MRIASDLAEAIGQTPLIRLRRVSEETGCEILGKAEFLNPGQSVKDRAALFIIRDAEAHGLLRPGGTIVEGMTLIVVLAKYRASFFDVFLGCQMRTTDDQRRHARLTPLFVITNQRFLTGGNLPMRNQVIKPAQLTVENLADFGLDSLFFTNRCALYVLELVLTRTGVK